MTPLVHAVSFPSLIKIHRIYSLIARRCSGGHVIDSCRGLKFFVVPRSCHVDQFTFHLSLPSLKILHLYSLIKNCTENNVINMSFSPASCFSTRQFSGNIRCKSGRIFMRSCLYGFPFHFFYPFRARAEKKTNVSASWTRKLGCEYFRAWLRMEAKISHWVRYYFCLFVYLRSFIYLRVLLLVYFPTL